ncbi:MAG: hypothetical protein WBA17_05615 [Saprospiraceae bacterium]
MAHTDCCNANTANEPMSYHVSVSNHRGLELDEPPVRIRTSARSENLCHLKTDTDPDGGRLRAEVYTGMLGGS